jgi:tetratricopeptide (TPR) repeat protein
MKAQRRHDLQQNSLGMEISKVVAFVRARATIILWCVLGAAAVALAVTWVVKNKKASAHLIQSQFVRLTQTPAGAEGRIDELQSLVDKNVQPYSALAAVEIGVDYSTTLAGQWAKLTQSERLEYRQKAAQWYEKVITDFASQDIAVAKAQVALARLAESFGEFDLAKNHYEQALKLNSLAGHSVLLVARQGLEMLPSLSAKPVSIWPDAPAADPTETTTAPATQDAPTQTGVE